MSYSQSPSMVMKTQRQKSGNRTLNDRDIERDDAGYNYQNVDKTIQDKKLVQYNQQLLKNLEIRTLKPMTTDYQKLWETKPLVATDAKSDH